MSLYRDTWPDLLRLGWPVSATLLVRVTMRTVDLIVIGLVVGAGGVAALGIGDAAARIVLFTALGLGAGTIAVVSQSLGADDVDEANRATTQTAVLAVVFGVPFTVAGWLGAPAFFDLLGAEPDVTTKGVTYLRIIISTAVPRMLAILLTRAFQGAGDTRTPLMIRSIGTSLNIALTVLLVTGVAGLPQLGVIGAAVGTAAGNVASAVLLVVTLVRGNRVIGFTRGGVWSPDTMVRIVVIAAPQVAERNLYALAAIPLNAIALVFGTTANAGFHIGRRVMLYGLLPSRGIATAASTYMGTRVGGRDPDAGERYGRGAIALVSLISLVVAVPLVAFAPSVAGVFVRDPAALDVAAQWVRAYAIAMLFRSVFGVLRSSMQGAGETRYPLVASAVGLAGFSLGFSWLVGVRFGVGLTGVFVGVVLDPAVRTAMLYRWFDTGRWRRALPAGSTGSRDARLATT